MKFLMLASIGFVFSGMIANAQQTPDTSLRVNIITEEVLTFVQQMPEFPGGEQSMLSYLRTNIDYPDSARLKNIQGQVIIRFVVNQAGDVTRTEVMRGVHPLLDDEALRVVNQMPQWKPGTQGGKPKSVYYTLPVSFTLR